LGTSQGHFQRRKQEEQRRSGIKPLWRSSSEVRLLRCRQSRDLLTLRSSRQFRSRHTGWVPL